MSMSVSKDDVEAMRTAADALRAGAPLPENAAEILADLLDSEAQMLASLEGFVELVGQEFEAVGAPAGVIRLGFTPEGSVRLATDNTAAAIRLARAVSEES